MRARRRTTATIGAVGLALTLALTGCGGGSEDTASSAGSAPQAGPALDAPAAGTDAKAEEQAAGEAEPGADPAKAPNLAVDQRSIIYTGSITVRVDDVNIAAARVTGIATGAGGFVGGDKRNSGSGSQEATLELRVPAAKFSTVVDQLAGLGHEEQRGINTEDVTEETIDLDARIATQQARVDSGRKLLAQAKSLNDLVMLEREVATREADLASLQAKKRRLADLTALSTITAVLLDPQAVANQDNDAAPGFLAGLQNGWQGLLTSLGVLLTVLGWLLPWLIALGLPIWGLLWLYRRYRPARAQVPAIPGFAMAGPAPGYPQTYPSRPQPQPQQPSASQPPASQPPVSQPPVSQPPTAAATPAAAPSAAPKSGDGTTGTAQGQPSPGDTAP